MAHRLPALHIFSLWNQAMNHKKMDPERVEVLRKEAVQHLHFVVGIYKLQLEGGRHFLHEHPATASSWQDTWMEKLMQHKGVATVVSDQCEYGLLTPGPDGQPMPAKKPTRWMSSSPHMLKRLSRRCQGDHAHQHLVGGRAKLAENYPIELITEILRGMRDTADFEEEWGDETESSINQAMLSSSLLHDVKFTSLAAAYRAKDLEEETKALSVKFKFKKGKVERTNLVFKQSYKDEYTLEELPKGHVRMAMHEELE